MMWILKSIVDTDVAGVCVCVCAHTHTKTYIYQTDAGDTL